MKTIEQSWQELYDKVLCEMTETMGDEAAARDYTEKMTTAMREFYTIYDAEGLTRWFAGLYEPNIVFDFNATEEQKKRYSGGAGFYYSNSARDNYKRERGGVEYQLLPDAETTAQAFGFISNSGMLSDGNGKLRMKDAFPEGEPEKIIRFIKALQDEKTGNFYHPQWLSMIGTPDYWDSRRSRDMTYSLSTLADLGASPTYDTPSGKKGDGILYDGTKIEIAREEEGARAEEAPKKKIETHPHLVSLEAFAEYLSTLNLAGNSYFVGNELASLASELKQRDREIGTPEEPRPLATMLDKWLRENQFPETGCWHDHVKNPTDNVYYATNGVLKILAMYNTLGMPFPNPLPAAKSAFAVITDPKPIGHVCDLYNTWFIVDFICYNLKKYGGDETLAKKIISDVRLAAIPAVLATADKMRAGFRKPDGSFSYFPDRSSSGSQNAPVALPNTNEGDVNATVIFTYGILNFMFSALDFGEPVRICTAEHRELFKSLIAEKASKK